MKKYILALDQGTTSSRAILFDSAGRVVSSAQREFPQHFPREGWVEHDPRDIWRSQREVMEKAAAAASPGEIAAVGITNQRETTLLWDRGTGEPVYNAIVWQCRRTADTAEALKERGLADYIRSTTGLLPDAYFSGTKLKWILDNVPGAREKAEAGELLFGTVDTWLIWNLTDGTAHLTDRTNASRTMLYDIHTLSWDEKLLRELEIPKAVLPEVLPSGAFYGETEINGERVPIMGVAGDQQAALFGQGCFSPGDAKNTYGTGCFALMNTGEKPVVSRNGLVTTLAATVGEDKPEYALEGSVFIGGAVFQWLRDELDFFEDSAMAGPIAESVPDNGGVYFVPAFTGLGAPRWDPYARGMLIGLTRGTKKAHIVRAAEEAVAFQVAELTGAMEQDAGLTLPALRVDGGASKDGFLMQFQADILGRELTRPACVETTALGAAFLAGLAAGFWKDKSEISAVLSGGAHFEPHMAESERRSRTARWREAVSRCLGWAK